MAIDNAVAWVFSPDLGEQFEGGDLAHTVHDAKPEWPSGDRFDPADASMGEFRRAARQYFNLSAPQVNALNADPADLAIPCHADWLHIADEIYIFIHRDFDGADEVNLPAIAQARLGFLRAGNPQLGKLL